MLSSFMHDKLLWKIIFKIHIQNLFSFFNPIAITSPFFKKWISAVLAWASFIFNCLRLYTIFLYANGKLLQQTLTFATNINIFCNLLEQLLLQIQNYFKGSSSITLLFFKVLTLVLQTIHRWSNFFLRRRVDICQPEINCLMPLFSCKNIRGGLTHNTKLLQTITVFCYQM